MLGRGELRRFVPGPLVGAQYGTEIGVRNVRVSVHDGGDRLADAREGNLAIKKR
jgi:hypothetical protein